MSATQLEQAIQQGDEAAALRCISTSREAAYCLLPSTRRWPLNLAIETKMVKLADALLAAGANPNENDCRGSPLWAAIDANQAELAVRLLHAGADPARHVGHSTILHCLARKASTLPEESARYLLAETIKSNVNPNQKDDLGTPLHHVMQDASSWIIPELCRAGADPNAGASNRCRSTPLQMYLAFRRPLLISTIIACGADTEMTSGSSATPLYNACGRPDRKCVEALLEGGANPNAVSNGWPLLALHAGDGNDELISLLIRYGANVDLAHQHLGLTPLMVAARLGHSRVVAVLRKAGARVDLRDHSNRAAIDFINEVSDPEKRRAVVESLQLGT